MSLSTKLQSYCEIGNRAGIACKPSLPISDSGYAASPLFRDDSTQNISKENATPMSKVNMSPYQQYIHKSRYARWVPELNRRENWDETVHRYISFFSDRLPKADRESTTKELEDAILRMEVMPSMRAMMTAGPALDKDNCAGYNCSYLAVDDARAFDEAMYISMCGTGVGFSVERQYVSQLPPIAENFYPTDTVIKVKDSKIGWANAFRQLIALLYGGSVPKWDVSAVRPAGAVLKTFGGRASGPEPLEQLFRFTTRLFQSAAGRKLTSIECHDLMCFVGDIVVTGGVRRSAMISLSNLSDDRMRNAKNGQWWIENDQRRLANNSVAYTEKPDMGIFMKEWFTLYESRSGERGIFNREGARKHVAKSGRRKFENIDFGVNPCGEILLRPKGFCNLTEVVIRPDDTKASIKKKIRKAVILGTLQSTLVDFRYLRKEWQKNAEEERLLGVSFTGIMDNKMMSTNGAELAKMLDEFREYAVEVNKEWAEKLGINQSAAVTCIKPSGTVSQLVDSSSGIHSRYSHYIERAVREDRKNPIGAFMKSVGVKHEPDVTKPNDMDVFYFPLESPAESVCRNDLTAIQQLELYLTYKMHWTEHNPSCTIYVRESEWLEVASWVYKHFDSIGGVSFLPHTDHIYKQAPYTEITMEDYAKLLSESPSHIDWDGLPAFETEDMTTAMKELACSAGVCEIADSPMVA